MISQLEEKEMSDQILSPDHDSERPDADAGGMTNLSPTKSRICQASIGNTECKYRN